MDNLTYFLEKAEKIDSDSHLTRYQKDVKLAGLMTDMERMYGIPMFRNKEWERDNCNVISIYLKISNMRNL